MSKTVSVTIDGRKLDVPYDARVLDVCARLGIRIPTMCDNENLKPYGVCRVCMVEMFDGRRSKLVPACVYTFRSSVEIQTDSEKVRNARRWVLEFMLAHSPDEKVVQELAATYGVEQPHPRLTGNHVAPTQKTNNGFDRYFDDAACILCGLCVRVCEEVVGASAIAFEGRGAERRVATPYNEENEACVACGACEFVCPTKCIGFLDNGGTRELVRWKKKTNMVACGNCGNYFMPEALAKAYQKTQGIPEQVYKLCTNCRKSVFAS